MEPLETTPWDTAEYLTTDEDISAYLDAVFEEGDAELISLALGNIARAKGMSEISRLTEPDRISLHTAPSSHEHIEFDTILKIMKALGLRLTTAPINAHID